MPAKKIARGDELVDIHGALEYLQERGHEITKAGLYARVRRGKIKTTRLNSGSTRDLRFFVRDLSEHADWLDESEKIKETHWSRKEFAEYLGYKEMNVYQMTMRLGIPHVKAADGKLYYDPDEVIEFIRAHSARVKARGERRGRPRKPIRGLEDEGSENTE